MCEAAGGFVPALPSSSRRRAREAEELAQPDGRGRAEGPVGVGTAAPQRQGKWVWGGQASERAGPGRAGLAGQSRGEQGVGRTADRTALAEGVDTALQREAEVRAGERGGAGRQAGAAPRRQWLAAGGAGIRRSPSAKGSSGKTMGLLAGTASLPPPPPLHREWGGTERSGFECLAQPPPPPLVEGAAAGVLGQPPRRLREGRGGASVVGTACQMSARGGWHNPQKSTERGG